MLPYYRMMHVLSSEYQWDCKKMIGGAWKLENYGEYSVKSAYRRLEAMEGAGVDQRAEGSGDEFC